MKSPTIKKEKNGNIQFWIAIITFLLGVATMFFSGSFFGWLGLILMIPSAYFFLSGRFD